MTKEKSSDKGNEEDSSAKSDGLKIEHSSVSTHKEILDHVISQDCELPVKPDSEIDDGGPLSI